MCPKVLPLKRLIFRTAQVFQGKEVFTMRRNIGVLLCVLLVLITIVAFGHRGSQEGKYSLVAVRFTDNGDGTVTDDTTGLIWLKDANCFGPLPWQEATTAVAGLADGQCGLSDGSSAGDWRVPEKGELLNLISELCDYPVLSNVVGTNQWTKGNPFSGVQSSSYWSATTYEYYSDAAWVGFVTLCYNRMDYEMKTRPHEIWPVRDEQ
jgi:hypothetical protein